MSTEQIRRCDQCAAIIPPSIIHYRLELNLYPFLGEATAGGMRSTAGEFCGRECVQRRISATLAGERAA